MIFDTHAHYNDDAFDSDRDELLVSQFANNICNIVNIASGMDSCISSMELAARYPQMYASVGVHPEELDGVCEEDMKLIEDYLDGKVAQFSHVASKIVAVGEIGLDYYWTKAPEKQAIQKEFFIRQLDIARKKKKPIIVHSRDAAADTMDIMKSEHAEEMGGVVHCFSYSYEQAKVYAEMGFYIGVGGVVTFKNGKKLKECVEKLPLESIVLETDCPYLAPEPNRGKRNNSSMLQYVVQTISEIKGVSPEEVMNQTLQNAQKLYRLI